MGLLHWTGKSGSGYNITNISGGRSHPLILSQGKYPLGGCYPVYCNIACLSIHTDQHQRSLVKQKPATHCGLRA